MKKYFAFLLFLIILPQILYGQKVDGEIIIHVKESYSGSLTFQTKAMSGYTRWEFAPDFKITNDFGGQTVTIYSPVSNAYLYFNRASYPNSSIAHGYYKIIAKKNGNELAYFKWDTRSTESWTGSPDAEFDFYPDLKEFRKKKWLRKYKWELSGNVGLF